MQINKAQNIQVQNLLGSITHKDVGAKSAAQAAPDVKIDVQYQEYINSALRRPAPRTIAYDYGRIVILISITVNKSRLYPRK
jgi:hypothetical protein